MVNANASSQDVTSIVIGGMSLSPALIAASHFHHGSKFQWTMAFRDWATSNGRSRSRTYLSTVNPGNREILEDRAWNCRPSSFYRPITWSGRFPVCDICLRCF